MNILHVLPLLAVLCIGCSEYPSGSGIVWIQYDALTSLQTYHYIRDDIPVPVVNDFLIEEGYTPSVLETYYNSAGEGIEVIHVGEDTDVSYLFDALLDLRGVLIAGSKIISLEGFLKEPPEEPVDEIGICFWCSLFSMSDVLPTLPGVLQVEYEMSTKRLSEPP